MQRSSVLNQLKAQSGLIEKYNIDKRNLFFFLKDVQLSYNEQVPYHNAVHATDILQAVYHALNKGNFAVIPRRLPVQFHLRKWSLTIEGASDKR